MNETVTHGDLTATGLQSLGFSDEQIARYEALRADYPLIEFVGSNRQLNQLRFMRWLHSQSRHPDDQAQ